MFASVKQRANIIAALLSLVYLPWLIAGGSWIGIGAAETTRKSQAATANGESAFLASPLLAVAAAATSSDPETPRSYVGSNSCSSNRPGIGDFALRSSSDPTMESESPSSNQQREEGRDDAGKKKKVKILGVGGGIGSGKSSACKLLVSELGCAAHIDADSVAHSVYEPGSDAVREIAERFGSRVMRENGVEVDRKALGKVVFADRNDMRDLEKIVWPHTKDAILKQIDEIIAQQQESGSGEGSSGGDQEKLPIVIVEAAVLLEAGWYGFMDGLWMVTIERDVAIERLVESRGVAREEAVQRIDAQQSRRGIGNLDDEVRNKVVSAVIDNSGTLDDLRRRLVEKLDDPAAWY